MLVVVMRGRSGKEKLSTGERRRITMAESALQVLPEEEVTSKKAGSERDDQDGDVELYRYVTEAGGGRRAMPLHHHHQEHLSIVFIHLSYIQHGRGE